MAKVTRKNPGCFSRLSASLKSIEKLQAKAGWMESAKYEDGTQAAYIAAIHEFGSASNGIPARPFMRPTVAAQEVEWKRQLAQGARAVLSGNTDARTVLEAVAKGAAGDVQKTISQITSPGLKDATIKNRLRKKANKKKVGNLTKPLVDTGYMMSSIDAVVESKK